MRAPCCSGVCAGGGDDNDDDFHLHHYAPAMSSLPLAFSAAHASKWDALPKDAHTTHTRLDLEGTTRASPVNDRSDDTVHGGCIPETLRTAASVAGVTVEGNKSHDMATKTYTWITLWFLLSAPVILWDAGYCFFRPRSMAGGDLHWFWQPYGIYQNIDYVYGVKALEENNGFTNAQSLLNLVETMLNLVYVYLAHVSSWPGAPLIGFTSATMTLSKTLLYWTQEYYCGGCAVGHNTLSDLVLLWMVPNGLWIMFPSLIVWRLGHDIVRSLSRSAGVASRKAQ